jgi:hypothetical protein
LRVAIRVEALYEAIAMLPSPTAEATRFTGLSRTSPQAKIPGALDSRRYGSRLCDQRPAFTTSSPVRTQLHDLDLAGENRNRALAPHLHELRIRRRQDANRRRIPRDAQVRQQRGSKTAEWTGRRQWSAWFGLIPGERITMRPNERRDFPVPNRHRERCSWTCVRSDTPPRRRRVWSMLAVVRRTE